MFVNLKFNFSVNQIRSSFFSRALLPTSEYMQLLIFLIWREARMCINPSKLAGYMQLT
jgi:hypothetical protein